MLLLHIKSRFTCGESNLYWNVALFRNIISAIVEGAPYNFAISVKWRI